MTHQLTKYEKITQMLRQARKAAGISQAELADVLGYSTSQTIVDFEQGRRQLPIEKFPLLNKALGYPLTKEQIREALVEQYEHFLTRRLENG